MIVTYTNYMELQEFYTIREACQFFSCEKAELRKACEKHGIELQCNESGEHGFPRHDICTLHNSLYHEQKKTQQEEDDPWA